jgi:hypothetical protein
MSFTSLKASEVIDTSLNSDDVPGYTFDYEYAIENSEYNRIYKDESKWYGVIELEDWNVFTVEHSEWSSTWINIANLYSYYVEIEFSRETEYLESIQIQFIRDAYCMLPLCIGGEEEAYDSGLIIYEYDDTQVGLAEAKNLEEVFGEGNITSSIDPDYDYVINLNHNANRDVHGEIWFFEFHYVLTEEEILDLRLDIQTQFNNELQVIQSDDTLSDADKEAAYSQLVSEYSQYEIDFGEIITSECDGDCGGEWEGENDGSVYDPESDWNTILENSIKNIIISVVIIVVGFIVIFQFGSFIIFELVVMFVKLLIRIAEAIYHGLKVLLIQPLIIGLELIVSTIISLLFWWVR